MTKTKAALIVILRARGITAAMASDADLGVLIDDAVTLYSDYRPALAFGAIATVADQAVYNLPAGGIHLRDGVYDPLLSNVDPTYSELETLLLTQEPNTPDFHNPSLMLVWRNKMSEWVRQCGGRVREMNPGSVQIEPAPTETGHTAIVLYTSAHTLATLPDSDEAMLLDLVRLLAREKLELETATAVGAGVAKRLGSFSYDDRGHLSTVDGISGRTAALRAQLISRLQGGGYGTRS